MCYNLIERNLRWKPLHRKASIMTSNPIETPIRTYLSRVVAAAVLPPDLSQTDAAHLPYVYSTTVDGPEAVAVMQDARRLGLTAKWACDFVATSGEIPAAKVAEWLLLPSSEMARTAVRLYLAGVDTDGTVIEADPFLVGLGLDNIHPVADEAAYVRQQDEMLGMLELVGKLLAGLGIQEHVAFEPLTENVIMIGQRLRLTKTASGWKVAAIDLGE